MEPKLFMTGVMYHGDKPMGTFIINEYEKDYHVLLTSLKGHQIDEVWIESLEQAIIWLEYRQNW